MREEWGGVLNLIILGFILSLKLVGTLPVYLRNDYLENYLNLTFNSLLSFILWSIPGIHG